LSSKTQLEIVAAQLFRSVIFLLSQEEFSEISRLGFFDLGRSQVEQTTWAAALEGDEVFIVSQTVTAVQVLRCRLLAKDIIHRAALEPQVLNPFRLILKPIQCGTIDNKNWRNWSIFLDQRINSGSPAIFQSLSNCCRRSADIIDSPQQTKYQWGRYSARVACTPEDLRFVRQVSVNHPFGFHSGLVVLIALQGTRRIGALVASLSSESNISHRASWRVFGDVYHWARRDAVFIHRIYSLGNADGASSHFSTHKWKTHRILLTTIAKLAPALTSRPITFLEGVSYDFQPVAAQLGWRYELPERITDSFYFWLPITYQSDEVNAGDEPFKTQVHELLHSRKELQFHVVRGKAEHIMEGLGMGVWALKDVPRSREIWKNLRRGGIIFFLHTSVSQIKAVAWVSSIERARLPNWEQYPLVIRFEDSIQDLDIDASGLTESGAIPLLGSGGIVHIEGSVASELVEKCINQKHSGNMWVTPNPYILHGTEFTVRRNQIFIVQSWNLRSSVLPTLRAFLEASNYAVKHASDREGQVVFEDIWLMLNESEVILVDFTERRPNVYLEYGMALVLGKPIIAITQSKDDIPSDTPNLKYILYRDKMSSNSELETLVLRSIRDTVADIERLKQGPRKSR
jgi:hypothetical protein